MSQQLQTDNTSANMDTDQQAPSDPGQPSSATTAPQHPLPATAVALSSVVKKLPQSYPFKGSSYYVRKCYEKYYGYMNDALENKYKIITVTGTPGIGKSVFYLYFEKYRKANPKKTIVTASFYKTRKLKECKVYEPGKEGVLINEVPKDLEDAIRLYDGPPEGEPLRAQMVTFTSPNHEWLKDALKKSNERRLFMPFWSLEELLEANKALKLKLADAEIERRFELFGGSARMCLQLDESNIDSYEKVKDYLDISTQTQDISHKLFFYVVDWDKNPHVPRFTNFVFCSQEVADRVYANIKDKSAEKVQILIDWVKGTPQSGSFLGWMFEGYCKQLLSKGGEFDLIPLGDQASTSAAPAGNIKLVIPKKIGYIHAATKNYKSIDGYYYDNTKNDLYLFQMTLNYDHSVKGSGIIEHLEKMGLMGVAGLTIYLVFVVSKGMEEFRRQTIKTKERFSSKSDLTVLKGVAGKKAEELSAEGIETVKQLLEAAEKEKTKDKDKVSKKILTIWENNKDFLQQISFFDSIGQYLLVTEAEFKAEQDDSED